MASRLIASAVMLLSIVIFTSCSSKAPQMEAQEAPEASGPTDTWGWDYEGPRGPESWGQLNSKYKRCETGQRQSPINLVWQRPQKFRPLKVNYGPGQATIINAGYTFRLELTPQSSIRFQNEDYILEKIEFRTPSEHQLSGNSFPMEVQFYHRSSNGLKQVIMSALAISGRESPWFELLWQISSTQPQFQSSNSFPFDPSQVVPDRQTYYNYEGSLTHPPCLEGVQWIVMNTPVQLSADQLNRFRSLFGSNNRPIQPLNNRKVTNH
jgi:carbonic anhydrase